MSCVVLFRTCVVSLTRASAHATAQHHEREQLPQSKSATCSAGRRMRCRGGKETPQDASLHGVRGPGSDSAWHTEAEAEEVGSPGSQASSMQATSWGGGVQSAFAPAATRQFSGLPDSSRSASPLPRSPGPAGQALHGAQGSQLR